MRRTIVLTAILALFFAGSVASAQEEAGGQEGSNTARITFPIAELGGCGSKSECKAYCDDSSHVDACLAFAEKNGLMKKEDAEKAREFSRSTGPGGCKGVACKAYCESEEHEEECLAFAKERGLVRAAEVSAVQDIKQNGGPGGCTSAKSCRAYCADSANATECRAFAEKHGLGPKIKDPGGDIEKKVKENPKIQALLEEKGGPGGCKNFEECHAFCEKSENASTCLAFAKDNQLIDNDDYDRAKKFTEIEGPGGCKGIACKAYCENPEHQEACLQFAREQGLISEEEAERVEKFRESVMRGGPGGCDSPESCRAFCSEEGNREVCMRFAEEQGFAKPQGEYRMMREGEDGEYSDEGQQDSYEGQGSGQRMMPPRGFDPNSEEFRARCAANPEACARMMNQNPTGIEDKPGAVRPMPKPGEMTPEMRQKYEMYRQQQERYRQYEGQTGTYERPMMPPPEATVPPSDGTPRTDPVPPPPPPPTESSGGTSGGTSGSDGSTSSSAPSGASVLWGVLRFLGVVE